MACMKNNSGQYLPPVVKQKLYLWEFLWKFREKGSKASNDSWEILTVGFQEKGIRWVDIKKRGLTCWNQALQVKGTFLLRASSNFFFTSFFASFPFLEIIHCERYWLMMMEIITKSQKGLLTKLKQTQKKATNWSDSRDYLQLHCGPQSCFEGFFLLSLELGIWSSQVKSIFSYA